MSTKTVATETNAGPKPGSSANANLYQKIAMVSARVGPIHPTGKTQFGQEAISIMDVEDALRVLLAESALVTGYTWNTAPTIIGAENKQTVWQADLTVWIRNADNPEEVLESHIYDIGSSPSAAVSFALKRYYRALFHLADDEDETRSAKVQVPSQGPRTARPRDEQAAPGASGTVRPSGRGASPAPPVPLDSQTALRKEAIIRLNRAFIASSLTPKDLTDKSLHLFGKAHRDDLTAAEIERLAEEIEQAPVASAKP